MLTQGRRPIRAKPDYWLAFGALFTIVLMAIAAAFLLGLAAGAFVWLFTEGWEVVQ